MQTRHSRVARIVLALGSAVLATMFSLFLRPTIEPNPFLLFLIAVALSAWYGGFELGLVTIISSICLAYVFLLSPSGTWAWSLPDVVSAALFVVVALVINILVETQRRAIHEEIKQKEWFSTIISSIGDGVIVTDAKGRIASVNQVAEQLTGWKNTEALGKDVREVFHITHEQTGQPIENPLVRVLDKNSLVKLQDHALLTRRDGQAVVINDSSLPIYDNKGNVSGAVLVFRDITEHKQKQRLQSLLAAIVEGSDDAIISKDLNATITSWNKAAQRIYGYTAEEAIGKPVSMLVPPNFENDVPHILESIKRRERVEHYETKRMCKDGTILDVMLTVSPICDENNVVIGASKIARDITERKREEAEHKQQSELRSYLAAIVEGSDDAIISKDLNAIITSWNKGAQRMYGYTAEEVVGKPISIIVPPNFENDVPTILARIKRGERIEHYETKRLCKDGTILDVSLTISPIYDEQGHIIGASKIARDITQNKRMEAALRSLNDQLEQRVSERTAALEAANQELEAFNYSISHDLRSPLRSINGFASILVEDYASNLPGEARKYLEMIAGSAVQMGALLEHLLEFSRLNRQPLTLKTVDPAAIAHEALNELMSQDNGRCFDISFDSLPPCQADPLLLKQIFVNVLSNALKFTREQPIARIKIGYEEQNNEGVYFVSDNGVGFNMAYSDKLFGVFQRLHRPDEFEGFGIGLALVQRIIRRHGGRIWATGELNKGATFYFTLG